VLFVGRVIPNKKIEDLVRAFAVYQRAFEPRSRLVLAGDHRGHERYYDRLQELVRELRVDEVVFTGHVDDDDLRACYAAADVFLCLSEHEGFCVPLQEAMLFGVPVIAFDAGAVAETLRGGGVLIRDKRPADVAALLDAVARRPELRAAVLAGQERAIEGVRRTDFGALVRERLGPVLAPAAPAAAAVP
jgi:glycosyltransferase involved in cell wall biosynthesis